MNDNYLLELLNNREWKTIRDFLDPDASTKTTPDERLQCVLHQKFSDDSTCLHEACWTLTPLDIVKSMIEIGGKELVMMTTVKKSTALNYSSYGGATFSVFKMLIDAGGKDLVLASSNCVYVDSVLHELCRRIQDPDDPNPIRLRYDDAEERIKYLLQVPGTEVILTAKDNEGRTPLDIATIAGASDEIKALLQPHTIKSEPWYADSDSDDADADADANTDADADADSDAEAEAEANQDGLSSHSRASKRSRIGEK